MLSGFVADEQGLGHITMTVDNLEQSLHFYRDVLGLRMSDWIRPQPERGVASTLNLAFLHCNPRHHSLAFLQMKLPKRLHHFMVQVYQLDDVGNTYYLCQRNNIPIDLTLGRHTNDQMLSFYMKSPSGFDVEFGWGAIEIDDTNWTVQLHTNGSEFRKDNHPFRTLFDEIERNRGSYALKSKGRIGNTTALFGGVDRCSC